MTASDFTEQLSKELIAEYGSIQKAARSVADACTSERFPDMPVSWRTVERWIGNAANDTNRTAGGRILSAGRITKAVTGTYQVVTKDDSGQPTIHTLTKSSVSVVPTDTAFPVVQAASPQPIIFNQAPYISRPVSYGVVISDVQFGYLRDNETGDLEPTHDPQALAVAKRITADIRPNDLFFIGDFVDWPTFSRWQKYPEYFNTLQPTIDGAHRELGEIIAAAGHQCNRRIMVGSNHQQRPEKFLLEYNMDALSIRRANSPPSSWPVFSEQYLLRYDDMGIEFSGQYPGGEYWVNPGLVLTHAPTKKLEFAADNIHGHTHRLTTTTWAQHAADGRHNYYQYDCGSLCQLGSTTNKRRLMITKVPSDRARTDWSQGIAVISMIGGKFPKHTVDLIKIDKGFAIYQGQTYDAAS